MINRKQRRAKGKHGPAPDTIGALFGQAIALHQAGRLAEAEVAYRQILARDPRHADSLHLLGVAAHQGGRSEQAEQLIGRAIDLNGAVADYHGNLGLVQSSRGRSDAAVTSYRRALALRPDYPEALGNLGHALMDQSNPAEALDCFERALALRPNFGDGHSHLGLALRALGRVAEAVGCFERARALSPGDARIHHHLGLALQELGRTNDAIAAFRQALALWPGYASAWNNLGNLLYQRGDLAEAIGHYQQALALEPGGAQSHSNLATALMDQGDIAAAVASFQRALALDPDNAVAHNNLGNALQRTGDLAGAVASYRRALALKPDDADAHNNLGTALKESNDLSGAVAHFEQALALRPDFPACHSNLIFVLDFDDNASTASQQAERRRWNTRHAAPLAALLAETAARPFATTPDPERPLRIGYVSADFRRHSAAFAFGPVLLNHDPAGFALYCYSGSNLEDGLTERFRAVAAGWRKTAGVGDSALAETIRADGIDILVDLAGHSAGNRLPVFARRPAPVQVTGWGHATGTGLDAMDYFLADPIAVPADERPLYRETVVDLPCIIGYEPPGYAPAVAPPPSASGGPIRFGSLSRIAKINAGVLDCWGGVLARVPDSRLILKDAALADPAICQQITDRFARHGIEAGRLTLLRATGHPEHLATYHGIDIALDTFPQGGGITTAEACWMGVPVVALRGTTPAGRVSASILTALGLPDWIADNRGDYIALAVAKAADPAALATLRPELRTRMIASRIADGPAYARTVEAAYRTLWRRWCERR